MGIQVPDHEYAALQELLQALDMRYEDETDNPAYRLFLH